MKFTISIKIKKGQMRQNTADISFLLILVKPTIKAIKKISLTIGDAYAKADTIYLSLREPTQ
jgi:hypothetical protein